MNAGRWTTALAVGVLVAALAWLLFVVLPEWYVAWPGSQSVPASVQAPAPPATPKIKAALFYVAEDGASLVGIEREIPFGGGTLDQGRQILEAQLAPAPAPLLSPVPAGTTLRSFFVSSRGHAYVDLGGTAAAHPGGSLYERLTVAAIVESLTANLPAIADVQILVDGREVETLAGHLDLRRAWTRHALWPTTATVQSVPGVAAAPPARD